MNRFSHAPSENEVGQEAGKPSSDIGSSGSRVSNTSSRYARQMLVERLRAEEALAEIRARRIVAEQELLEAGS